MIIKIEENGGMHETEITIRCPEINDEINNIVAELRLFNRCISGKRGENLYVINFTDIFYFDTADRKTFIYTKDGVYETSHNLQRLEEMTGKTSFVRANKSCIINLKKVRSFSNALTSSKMTAYLDNGEKIEISRMYAPLVR
ncbi:MAG: LytTR family transcriptional regulator DNA-binding domain-containing protein [Defluviitaleaceae bacterium]|nr:LytTR family transcriptional regulator DNA-binding domain-containing protein [Defluviitaleaceae bacterium]